MHFEFHSKIKGKGAVDRDFSKGLLVRNVCGDTPCQLNTLSLKSCLSNVDLVYVPATYALEASIGVCVLNGKTKIHGEISAWTSANDRNKIILYDSEVVGTDRKLGSGGSVSLSRWIVSVPLDEDLVLGIFARGSNNGYSKHQFVLGHGVQERFCKMGPYELQVNIIWKAIFRQERPDLWKDIGEIEFYGGDSLTGFE